MRAQTILVASQKGGAGKTTLTSNLAVVAARNGRKVVMIDLDPQKSLRAWWQARAEQDIQMLDRDPRPEAVGRSVEALRDQVDLILIDTPPAHGDWLSAVMGAADLCIIPVRPSPHDLRAVGATLGVARDAGVPHLFVLSQAPLRARLVDESARVIAAHGRLCPKNLHNRVVYAETGATGQGVIETSDAKAGEEVAAAWAFVQEALQ